MTGALLGNMNQFNENTIDDTMGPNYELLNHVNRRNQEGDINLQRTQE